MKMAAFWFVAPWRLIAVYRRFRGACYVHRQGDDDVPDSSSAGQRIPAFCGTRIFNAHLQEFANGSCLSQIKQIHAHILFP
jgi:hypothetical protein